MEKVIFEPWTEDRLGREAIVFLGIMRKYNDSFSKHDFKILFRAYLTEGLYRGYIENGKVKFYCIPDEDMFENVVENLFVKEVN